MLAEEAIGFGVVAVADDELLVEVLLVEQEEEIDLLEIRPWQAPL